jgi:hypothetical protein
MPKIHESIEIKASKDRVWEIISDIDHEPDYWWGTKEVKNMSKNGNTIDREITQNFRNHKISQRVILRPKDEVETRYLKGLTEGTKLLKLESKEDAQNLQACWDVHFPGLYILLSYLLARHIRKGTRDALQRIKLASERN